MCVCVCTYVHNSRVCVHATNNQCHCMSLSSADIYHTLLNGPVHDDVNSVHVHHVTFRTVIDVYSAII